MKNKMTEVEMLRHRLAMVRDDLDVIINFIYANNLDKKFRNPSETSDDCWNSISNIEIACDLDSEESLNWELFDKELTN
jgi:hypothetical protein